MDWREQQAGMDCLTALDFGPDPGLDLLRELVEKIHQKDCLAALRGYNRFYRYLNEGGWHSLGEWLWDRLRDAETPYGRMCQRGERDESLIGAARWECTFLRELCELPAKTGSGIPLSGFSPLLLLQSFPATPHYNEFYFLLHGLRSAWSDS